MRTVDITMILPTDKYVFTDPNFKPQTTFKTLYLLHGILAVHLTGLMAQELKLGLKKKFGGRDAKWRK